MGKYYVVFHGRKPGIYEKWNGEDGCNAQINKFPGALYKSFEEKEKARECWEKNHPVEFTDYELTKGKGIIYAAGCFNPEKRQTAYAVILTTYDSRDSKDGLESYPLIYGEHNGQGELDAVVHALDLAYEKGCYDVLICHSYVGSFAWGTGLWKADSAGAVEYAEHVKNAIQDIHFASGVPEDNSYMKTVKRLAHSKAFD